MPIHTRALKAPIALLATVVLFGCASASGGATASSHVTAPVPLAGSDYAHLQPVPGGVVDFHVQVMVDPGGHADLSTLKLTGSGVAENRAAVEEWLRTTRFQPAQRNGRAVAGMYEIGMRIRTRVVRRT